MVQVRVSIATQCSAKSFRSKNAGGCDPRQLHQIGAHRVARARGRLMIDDLDDSLRHASTLAGDVCRSWLLGAIAGGVCGGSATC